MGVHEEGAITVEVGAMHEDTPSWHTCIKLLCGKLKTLAEQEMQNYTLT